LIFEEPPPKERGPGAAPGQSPMGLWLAELRNHPNAWAKYPERVHCAVMTRIRSGKYGVGVGEYEASGRNTIKGRCDLYARYIGGGDPA